MGIRERREREREARRRAVLDAARALVRERGFGGATTRQIAERCELSEATLFWYFQSKEEIFTSLLFEGIDFMAQGLEKIESAGGPVPERLASLWGFFSEVQREHPEYFQVFSTLAHPQAFAAVAEGVKAEIARRSGDNFRRLATLVQDLAGAESARIVADLVWAAFVGLMVLRDSRANVGARPHPTEAELRRAFRILWNGIAPRANARRR